MKRLALIPFALFAAIALAGEKPLLVKVAAVLKDPAKYDEKDLEVTGKVEDFKSKTSKKGNAYFNFKLVDGKEKLSVYGQGRLRIDPGNGEMVKVTGRFVKEKTIGTQTFKNEIDVSTRIDEAFGVVILKK